VATEAGCPRVLRVNGPSELPDDLAGVVGVTAGASAPEELVRGVIEALAPHEGVEEVSITTEDEYFPPPRELRDAVAALNAAVVVAVGGPPPAAPFADDRRTAASDVLEALSSDL
jgi:4-hydroxy-3-methylbut-2-enyl diphosphate reductase